MPSHSREVWGPRVWRLLHRLSFYSDRRDVVAAWRGLLKTLSETMPCALCRGHMKAYLVANPIAIKLETRGPVVKEYMIEWVYRFHNHVRLSGGGIEFPFEELVSLYGAGGHGLCVEEAAGLLAELAGYWSDLPTREFRTAVSYLISLIRGGTLV
jgi:hypothetical protein